MPELTDDVVIACADHLAAGEYLVAIGNALTEAAAHAVQDDAE